MRKISKMLVFLTMVVISSILNEISAYQVINTTTGEIEETTELPQVNRTVEKLSNGTKVTYQFDKILIIPDPIYERK